MAYLATATAILLALAGVSLAAAPPARSRHAAIPVLRPGTPRSLTPAERAALTSALGRVTTTSAKAQQRRVALLRTAAAHTARVASRERYRHLSGARATALAHSLFGSSLFALPLNARSPRPGVRGLRALDSNTEVVANTQTGKRALMVSSAPLEVPNASGGQSPVNLAVTDTGASFKPANALVPITIGKRLQDGVTFTTAGFSFALQATGSDAPTSTPSGVFFANAGGTATGADFALNPTSAGVESFVQIRAASSPERYVLHFTLPAGAALAAAQSANPIPGDPPTAIAIMRAGRALGYVYQPAAVDADGTPVAASAAIAGSNVVLTVVHHGKDLHYPVLLDPIVSALGSTGNWRGWTWAQNDTYLNQQGSCGTTCVWTFGKAIDDPHYWPGLYTSMPAKNKFQSGDAGLFYYPAPTGTYIGGAAFIGAHNAINTPYDPGGFSNYFIGLSNASGWAPGVSNYNGSSWQAGNPAGYSWGLSNALLATCFVNCDPGPGSSASVAYMGIQAVSSAGTILTGGYRDTVTANSSLVYLGDLRDPAVGNAPVSIPTWTNDHGQAYSSQAQLSDIGLGIQRATVTATTGTAKALLSSTAVSQCGDYYVQPCPGGGGLGGTQSFNPQFSYTLPEGQSSLTYTATDPTGRTGTGPASTVLIDRTPPTATLSTVPAVNQSVALSGNAIDPPAPGANASSGIAHVDVWVMPTGGSWRLVCAGLIPGTAGAYGCNWNTTGGYPDGPYTVAANAYDNAGNLTQKLAPTVVDNGPPVTIGAPTITGTAQDGSVLSATPHFASATPATYTYQWQRCDTSGANCAPITSAATRDFYLVYTPDVGSTLRVQVVAANAAGSSNAISAPTTVVTAAPPAADGAPVVDTSALMTNVLTVTGTSFGGTPTMTYTYQWDRCDESTNSCSAIPGATGLSYTLQPADTNAIVRARVTATNAAGSTSAVSHGYYTPPPALPAAPIDPGPTPSTTTPQDDAIAYRQDMGLNADPAYVASLLASPDVEAMSRNYGTPLTADEQHEMLTRQQLEQEAAQLDATAQATYGATYGGMTIDQANGGRIVMTFTSNAQATVNALGATVPYAAEIVAHTVAYSLSLLNSTVDLITTDLDSLASSGIAVLGVAADETANRVHIILPSTPASSVLSQLTALFGTVVDVLVGGDPVPDGNSRFTTYPPLVAGLAIESANGYGCSNAFTAFQKPAVQLASTSQLSGSFYSATAAHCDLQAGVKWDSNIKTFGKTVTVNVNNSTSSGDALSIGIAGHDAHPSYYAAKNDDRFVTGFKLARSDQVGAQVCLSARNGAGVRCGKLVYRNYLLDYPPQHGNPRLVFRSQRLATYRSSLGDSGGAVVMGSKVAAGVPTGVAEGIHSGTSPVVSVDGAPSRIYAVFGQINNAYRQLKMCVLTTESIAVQYDRCEFTEPSGGGSDITLPEDFLGRLPVIP